MALKDILYEVVSPILAGLIIIVNFAEIVMLTRKKRGTGLSTPMIYVLTLSISDLSVGVIIACVKGIYFMVKTNIIHDKETAKTIIYYLQDMFLRMSLLMSLTNLISLTTDRMISLRTMVKRSKKRAVIVCVVNAVGSVGFVLIYFFSLQSFIPPHIYKQYEVLVFSALVFPSAVYFFIAYTLIIRYARHQHHRIVGTHRFKKFNEMMTLNISIEDAMKQRT